ncbi:MAG: cadmium-translocating P-type ATPase [Selenomonadaceae bacterium]|nr:cadmium-translocating P-type ATPase [Selenomonadaceae bacterium]
MNRKQRKNLLRIIAAAALMIGLNFVEVAGAERFALYMVPYLIVGYDILIKAARGIKNLQALDENFLMAVATIGAIVLAVYSGSGDYTEAVAVMLFYQIGEWFQSYAIGRSRQNISALMDIRPDYANIENLGRLEQVDPSEIETGTTIIIQPGEKVPLDGVVVDGNSTLNTSALTGESLPRNVAVGDEVLSGCINLNGVLKVRTTKLFEESTASKILDLVENASSRKSRSENFITKFARIYTPVVVGSAVALAVIPSLVTGDFATWLYRALIFLVISCPCALVISIPLTFFAGLGGASRAGILIKGSNFLETLSKVKTVVMDKTGTLTRGIFEVDAVHPISTNCISENPTEARQILHYSAHVEKYSTHPIATSIRKAYPAENDGCTVENVEELAGLGIRAEVNGNVIHVGNEKLMEKIGAAWKPCDRLGTIIHVAVNGAYAGHVIVADKLKPRAKKSVEELYRAGVNRIVMLTGDLKKVAAKVAGDLGIGEYYAELLPAQKVERLESILSEKSFAVAFVGDGINDAPVLARADIGIAMGALGADAAIEAADVVLMDDDPLKISRAIEIAKKTLAIVRENIYFAIGVKVLCLALGAVGIANMWFAIFADVGVMVLAVLNALRALSA